MRDKKMKTLKELLCKKKKCVGNQGLIDEKSIEGLFISVILKEFQGLSRSDIREVLLRGEKLFIRTIHPAVAREIEMRSEKIINRINNELGRNAIASMKMK